MEGLISDPSYNDYISYNSLLWYTMQTFKHGTPMCTCTPPSYCRCRYRSACLGTSPPSPGCVPTSARPCLWRLFALGPLQHPLPSLPCGCGARAQAHAHTLLPCHGLTRWHDRAHTHAAAAHFFHSAEKWRGTVQRILDGSELPGSSPFLRHFLFSAIP